MQEFIAHKIPTEKLQVNLGSWIVSNEIKQSGFVISDAHGDNFWRFSIDRAVTLADLPLPKWSHSNIPVIAHEDYLVQCQSIIDEMISEDIGKVVYSRVKAMSFAVENFKMVFEALCLAYPDNLNYCLYGEHLGFWMGSTPEILIKGERNMFTSMALAGTLACDSSDDLWTNKEREEQQYVSDYLEEIIEKYGRVTHKSKRYIHQAGPVKHLRNDFYFDMASSEIWNFIRDFHPTPAVCGVPKLEAKQCYEKHEQHKRALYTGIIGYSDENSTSLFVNLRCMQLFKNQAALYVGGGLTQHSMPKTEWLETERKADTLGQFLK